MRAAVAGLFAIAFLAACLGTGPEGTSAPTTSPSGSEPAPSWSMRTDMPVPRTEVTCASHQGNIYVVGGFTSQNLASQFFHVYEPTSNAWRALADFPIPIHHTGLVAYGTSLYAFGGYTGNSPFVGTRSILRYDPSANTWSPDGLRPVARGAHTTILAGNEVYLVGGAPNQPSTETYRSTDIYNFTTRAWRTGPDLRDTREHLAGSFAAGQLVVAGGRRMSLANFDTTETLVPGQPPWTVQDPMPTARGGLAAATHATEAIFFGGERSGGTHDEAESYDVQTAKWTRLPAMPHARHGLCAATLEDGIHVIGGGPMAGLTVGAYHEVLSWP